MTKHLTAETLATIAGIKLGWYTKPNLEKIFKKKSKQPVQKYHAQAAETTPAQKDQNQPTKAAIQVQREAVPSVEATNPVQEAHAAMSTMALCEPKNIDQPETPHDNKNNIVEESHAEEEVQIEETAAEDDVFEKEETEQTDINNIVEPLDEEVVEFHVKVDTSDVPRSDLIKPATFVGEITEDGADIRPITYVNNSKVLAKYPRLAEIESFIRSNGFDCHFFETPNRVIVMSILERMVPIENMVFTIDVNRVVLGPEPKWIPAFVPDGNYENFPCINLNNFDLMLRVIQKDPTLTVEELRSNSMYSAEYIAVSRLVDLNTFPATVTKEVKDKIISRLARAIKNGVFDSHDYKSKFVVARFISLVNFTLRSGSEQIDVKKDSIVTGEVVG